MVLYSVQEKVEVQYIPLAQLTEWIQELNVLERSEEQIGNILAPIVHETVEGVQDIHHDRFQQRIVWDRSKNK